MDFDADTYEDAYLARLQQAVAAGLLAWVGLIGDEDDARRMPKHPGLAILLRHGGMSAPHGIDVTRQTGIIEWTVFAGGSNRRSSGRRPGRRGEDGAYHAIRMAIRYSVGYELIPGFPLWLDSFQLAGLDQKHGTALYEIGFRHEISVIEDGFD